MNRRAFLRASGVGLIAPCLAQAQSSSVRYHVGLLYSRPEEDNSVRAFRKALGELGYREGQNLLMEYRWAGGNAERFRKYAAELAALKVQVLVTSTTPGALAARSATSEIPIVFAGVGDPVEAGVVSNLAHPGGNITGLTHMSVDLSAKTVELVREAVPSAIQIGVLAPLQNPTTALKLRGTQSAARSFGLTIQIYDVRSSQDFDRAFLEMRKNRPQALITLLDTLTVVNRSAIADFAVRNHLPSFFELRDFVDAGGMLSYGTSFPHMWSRAAIYVDKILKGARPGDLPVERPTNFELVLNLKTAKAIGLTVPQSLILRADDVIQ